MDAGVADPLSMAGHRSTPPSARVGQPGGRPAVPLLVFSDDWGRHPSSAQHLVSRFLGTRMVLWVNTIGTRPPRLDMQTVRRAMEKLRHWSGRPAASPNPHTAPTVLSPRMWPSFGSRSARRVNRRLIAGALQPAIARLPLPPLVITTLPITADLVGAFPAAGWIYYCVDDFATWPGYDGQTMRVMERELVAKVDRLVAVSAHLVDHLGQLGRPSELLTHGVDLAHWQQAQSAGGTVPDELAGLEPPFVVFWGAIDRRMDRAFVSALSDAMRQGSIVLVGPQDDPDPTLVDIPRVALRPAVPYARLPAIGGAADVLVMPYGDMPATRAMQPLKLKEYLATGKPVVVRALPATLPWARACDVCDSAQSFAAAVLQRLESGVPVAQQLARRALDDETWEAKALALSGWIDALTAPPPAVSPAAGRL